MGPLISPARTISEDCPTRYQSGSLWEGTALGCSRYGYVVCRVFRIDLGGQTMATNNSLQYKFRDLFLVRPALVAVAAVIALVGLFSFNPGAAKAQAPVAPASPLTITFRIEIVEAGPVPADAIVHGAVRCPNPKSKFIGAGIDLEIELVKGFWHINAAAEGQGEGIEENYVFYFDGAPTTITVPEGAAWWFRQECFANDLNGLWYRVVRDSTDDFWPTGLPAFLAEVGGITLMEPPAIEGLRRESAPVVTPTYVWAVQPVVIDAPAEAAEFVWGKVAQGEDLVAVALGYCELAWWTRGDSKEYVTWFVAAELTEVGLFNGTMTCWKYEPAKHDLNMEHDFRSVVEAEAAGVKFTPAVKSFTPAD